MTELPVTPTLENVASLYRRFRPGTFAELRGQDHIVRALQGAVRNGRVSHAYLFSGPRGTGKTTTARILAKALNCEAPVDGDACNVCASCVAITKGASLDVTELDAASNNGVEDIRDIVAGAWHGTPGRWKVYIFDEVHQLSKSASAALLKTLEEPPAHVIFVLATTDPHKVLPTIRSRTQHLEFRLLPGDTLESLLNEVREKGHLEADEATIEAAVRLGRGSARDALSALDQLLATGSLDEARPDFDELLAALVAHDAAQLLSALATLGATGWDPDQLAESLAGELRQIFLLQVAPDVADAVTSDRERLGAWAEQLGLARTVNALETVGRAMREMRSAPVKMVMLEVALVRLVHPELNASYNALEERVRRLEQGAVAPAAPAAPLPPIAGSSSPRPAAPTPAVTSPVASPPTVPPATDHRPVTSASTPEASPSSEPVELSLEDVRRRFSELVVPRTPRSAQLVLRSSTITDLRGNVVSIAVSSEEVRGNTEIFAGALRAAMEHEFKTPLVIEWVVDPSAVVAPSSPPKKRAAPVRPVDDVVVASEDDVVVVVDSAAEHLITNMFPGAEEIS